MQATQAIYEKLGINIPYEVFKQCAEKYRGQSYEQLEDLLKKRKAGEFSESIRSKFGCIFTPEFVIDKTLDLACKYHPGPKLSLTYIDPACGDGNFLISLYHRLMKEESELDPIAKSEHILLHCLFGVEIIDTMYQATKIRLMKCHFQTVKANGGKCEDWVHLFDKLNIYHGNTILTPEDNFEREAFEGGLLSDEVRSRKYDVIVGNPPYTHLRNLQNRRYAAYPRQRDMAQVFVRWALDHLDEDGVCSFNTSDAWIRYKTTDGADETRKLLMGLSCEIQQDDDIENYSKGIGDIGTLIVCLCKKAPQLVVNGTFLNQDALLGDPIASNEVVPYRYITLQSTVHEHRHCTKRFFQGDQTWNDFIFKDEGSGDYYLLCKKRLSKPHRHNFKLVRTEDPKELLNRECSGQPKYLEVSFEDGMWLVGFLNSDFGLRQLKTHCRLVQGNNRELGTRAWQNLQVPDFDWYLTNRPEQHAAFLAWVEANIRDKDRFLAGIDEEFQKLIG